MGYKLHGRKREIPEHLSSADVHQIDIFILSTTLKDERELKLRELSNSLKVVQLSDIVPKPDGIFFFSLLYRKVVY